MRYVSFSETPHDRQQYFFDIIYYPFSLIYAFV